MDWKNESTTKPIRWAILGLLAWELTQMVIGVYYGVSLALSIT